MPALVACIGNSVGSSYKDCEQCRAGIFKQSMGARHRRNRVIVLARLATLAGGIHSLESILRLHKRIKIRALTLVAWIGNTVGTSYKECE